MVPRILRKFKSIALHSRIHRESEWLRHAPFDKITVNELQKNAERLRPQYNKYVSEVSTANMAASIELAALMLTLCQVAGYKKIVDLGSGFTSYVLRLYAQQAGDVEIYSVDDDAQWLEKTRDFLHTTGVSDKNLMTLDLFLASGEGNFDCILHDLNFVEVRINYVSGLLGKLSHKGILILDDMHKPDYRLGVLQKLATEPFRIYSLQNITGDNLGRYSMVTMRA